MGPGDLERGGNAGVAPSWIDEFMRTTDHLPSPPIFRKWSAISAVACALQRNCWVVTSGRQLFPNLYVVLVAPPGLGKSVGLDVTRKLIGNMKNTHFPSRSSLTPASFIDDLHDAERKWVRPQDTPAVTSFNSLAVISSELGVLLPQYDSVMMNTLQDLYDCGPYSQRRRTKELVIDMPKPQVNILAGCTPAYLQSTLPEAAWAEGFSSRTIFVFSGEQVIRSLFDDPPNDEENLDRLQQTLVKIGDMFGQFTFTEEAKTYIDAWHQGGRFPEPEHPRLYNYNARRTVHVLKLSMVASAAESRDRIITKEHIQIAMDWLIEAEHFIPEIFKAMNNTSHTQILQDVWHYVFETYRKENNRPVARARVINVISQKVPAHSVERVLEVLCNAGYLKIQQEKSGMCVIPRGKTT